MVKPYCRSSSRYGGRAYGFLTLFGTHFVTPNGFAEQASRNRTFLARLVLSSGQKRSRKTLMA
jgi:hypothetical protein